VVDVWITLPVTAKSDIMPKQDAATDSGMSQQNSIGTRWGKLPWLALSVVLIAVDLITKHLVSGAFYLGEQLAILPFFNLTLAHNSGAAFSFLYDAGGWQRWFFSFIALAVSAVIIRWLYKLKPEQTLLAVALSCVLGGAIGNLVDRLTLGYVVDFIQVYWRHWYFPSFNVADSAITLGAGLLILDAIINPEPKKET